MKVSFYETKTSPLADPKKLFLGVAFAMSVLSGTALAQCNSREGQKVTLIEPNAVSDKLSAVALQKGEFETTPEFEARKVAALKQNSTASYIIKTTVYRNNIRYDADRQRFIISIYAWANVNGGFSDVFGYGGAQGFESVGLLDEIHGLGLGTSERDTGTYVASNAYGKSVNVTIIDRTRYSVFDRKTRNGESTWKFDFNKKDGAPESGIFLNVAREKAPQVKNGIQFGVEYHPRTPFVVRGKKSYGPRIDNPREVNEKIEVFIGKLTCLVVANDSGEVLRAIPSAY